MLEQVECAQTVGAGRLEGGAYVGEQADAVGSCFDGLLAMQLEEGGSSALRPLSSGEVGDGEKRLGSVLSAVT